ncbi:MAG: TlpA family protein disulfide reductase [Defluviitaleaceae bacterium]|nr:TlpA family protein disulfide reductase [Defluviitaleaceae bacterium]
MNKKLKALVIAGCMAVILAGAFSIYHFTDLGRDIDTAVVFDNTGLEQAADIIFTDVYGNEIFLSDFFGQPIVLNFWTTWCPNCVRQSPYFEALYQKKGDEIKIIKINLIDGRRETWQTVEAFMYNNNYSFPLFFDTTQTASFTYNARTIPVTHFINPDGYIVASEGGLLTEESMARNVARITP